MTPPPRVYFYERTPVGEQWRYDRLNISSADGSGVLRTAHPPMVGDLLYLQPGEGQAQTYRVVGRAWMHPARGSAAWPLGEAQPVDGPMLDVLVEAAPGLFRDEAPLDDDTEGETS